MMNEPTTDSNEYAKKVISLAVETIMVRFRYFDVALNRLVAVPDNDIPSYLFDGTNFRYNPSQLLKDFVNEPNFVVRLLLHMMFHGLFLHFSLGEGKIPEYWDFASDIAVENIILKLENADFGLIRDTEARSRISKLSKWITSLTGPKIYREFAINGVSNDAAKDYKRLFGMDVHYSREPEDEGEDIIVTEDEWRRIAERVKTELTDFNKEGEIPTELLENLKTATTPRYDYEKMLAKFATLNEEIKVNPDEFDYLFYTYGLDLYGNMPLIEPLEYTEEHKIRDFVIVLDTSASCKGDTIVSFVRKTYEILKNSGSFSSRINIHIIQCDAQVREDKKIDSKEELETYLESFSAKGFGATDFRPAFAYVDELVSKKEFTDLKGLIYFTDGYGVYPSKCPEYDVMFAFLGEDEMRAKPPAWAIKVSLEDELIGR